jgi:hypothetical protein
MMNKHFAFKAVLFSLACAVALLLSFLFRVKNESPAAVAKSVQQGSDQFDANCYTTMKKDTLIQLLNIAYGSAIQINGHEDELQVRYTAADQAVAEFYNGNDKLLKTETAQFGFKLSQQEGVAEIVFKCNADAVNVPNDLLIRLVPRYKLKLPDMNEKKIIVP